MKAHELLSHFLNQSPWIDPATTVDRIIIGDANKNIGKLLVVWQPSLEAVTYAAAGGYDAIMTHEPTFYFHKDELACVDALPDASARKQTALKKRRIIEDAGLTVIRNHDVWDRFPHIGIPYAWAKRLGLPDEPSATIFSEMQHQYAVAPITAAAFAARMAERLKTPPGQVQLFGDGGKVITSVGIGTGCCCKIDRFAEMGCDAAIVCDDGTSYWSDLSLAIDMGMPVIRVFHATSEDDGIRRLAEYLRQHFPAMHTDYLPFDAKAGFL